MEEKNKTFVIKANATFMAKDLEAAMILIADHLKKVATEPDYDGTIFTSGSIEIKAVKNDDI